MTLPLLTAAQVIQTSPVATPQATPQGPPQQISLPLVSTSSISSLGNQDSFSTTSSPTVSASTSRWCRWWQVTKTWILQNNAKPSRAIALSSLCIFILFVVLLCLAARWPVRPWRDMILGLGIIFAVGVVIACLWSLFHNCQQLSFTLSPGDVY